MTTKIIAEIASCHNGDIQLAKKMIREVAKTGVDIVKFQSWQAGLVKDSDPDKKRYEKYELSDEAHFILKKECERNGVEFLTTCYNVGRIPFLKKLGLKKIKVSSTNLHNKTFLKAVRDNFKEVIVSMGMSTKKEIEEAIKILKTGEYTIMHCVSIYPTPIEKANMRKLLWLKELTKEVGYSDHVAGFEVANLAIGMGIKYLEKHFTTDKHMEQVSHSVSKISKPITTHAIADEPPVFKEIVRYRDIFAKAMGAKMIEIYPEEKATRVKYTDRFGTLK